MDLVRQGLQGGTVAALCGGDELALLIGEIGDKNKIEVTQDEMRRALMEHARRFPGQEKNVYEYFEKTPGALQELRAPIFEDKVIDFVLELAKPAEKKVSRQELIDSLEKVTEALGRIRVAVCARRDRICLPRASVRCLGGLKSRAAMLI